jgi:hypothetical protein
MMDEEITLPLTLTLSLALALIPTLNCVVFDEAWIAGVPVYVAKVERKDIKLYV